MQLCKLGGLFLHDSTMAIPDLLNHWVLVTGAASGIGFETALSFTRAGASLIITDIQPEPLEIARRRIVSMGGDCVSLLLDVSDPDQVHDVAQTIEQQYGVPSVVVNNAGIGYLGPFLHTPLEAWRRVIDVNLMGMVHMCQAFLPMMMLENRPTHLVNVASAAGLHPAPNLSAYSASKHAVMGLHDALAMELASSKIGLTVVCPGVINTPIVRNRHAVADIVPAEQLSKIADHYEKHGAHPSLVGQRIVKAVQTGEQLVLVGPTAKALYTVKRLSRSLAHWATVDGCKKNGYMWRYPDRGHPSSD